jgi:hypothetical protein
MVQVLQEEKGERKSFDFEFMKKHTSLSTLRVSSPSPSFACERVGEGFRVRRPHPRPFSSTYWLSNDAGVARGEGRRKKF